MSAHYPAQPPYESDAERVTDREQNILPPVTIDGDRNTIVIGETELPGQWISDGDICLEPGGESGINTLTVTFLVGSVDITDSALAKVSVKARVDTGPTYNITARDTEDAFAEAQRQQRGGETR